MDQEPDGYEESARIVEAFVTGADDATDTLLTEIAKAIRDRSKDD